MYMNSAVQSAAVTIVSHVRDYASYMPSSPLAFYIPECTRVYYS